VRTFPLVLPPSLDSHTARADGDFGLLDKAHVVVPGG